jgi:dTDP-4-amino-4,6-dideoxygalactose transaminase
VVEHARTFRNYGKPEYRVQGLNYRMNEFTAAVGIVEVERLDEITMWKNEQASELLDPRHPARVELPDGMVSGRYKYIVFEPIERSTGKVYEDPCHRILGTHAELPNSDWVAANHWCVPLYYRPAATADVPARIGP